MLFKLSLSGLRSRFKDYLVLFSGLITTSAIFYMFLVLSTNPQFLNQNQSFKLVGQVFLMGNILLGLITLIYVTYANSFLLSMRQRDYGLFMMLGAKSSKIGNLIFVETLFLGVLATLVGSALGILITQTVANLLVGNLGLAINGFIGFHLPAVLWTLLFFFVLFFLAALFNRVKIAKTSVLNLLKSDDKPVKYRRRAWWIGLQAILGVGGLSVAYYIMLHIIKDISDRQTAFIVMLVATVLGTYFVFNAFFTVIINLLKKWRWLNSRRLNNFTLNQLKFRITSYTRILSVVSLLFAMAVGAITVALMMRDTAFEQSDTVYYDVQIYQNKPEIEQEISKLSIKEQSKYHYKVVGETVYGLESELKNQKLTYKEYIHKDGGVSSGEKLDFKITSVQGDEVKDTIRMSMIAAYNQDKPKDKMLIDDYDQNTQQSKVLSQFVSQEAFNQLQAPEGYIQFIKTTGLRENLAPLQKIWAIQNSSSNESTDESTGPEDHSAYMQLERIDLYQAMNSILSIFQFIGLFLGIAFLTMLASILIFKILSGAYQDQKRYEMLDKIGARKSALTKSIARELAVLFILPAAMGVTHMLFGLKLFEDMVSNIYSRVWLPVGIFLALYALYYLLTLFIYCSIVLPKRKK